MIDPKPYRALGLKDVQLRQAMVEFEGRPPWRISTVEGELCTILGGDDDGGAVSRRGRPPMEQVAVGDWVVLNEDDEQPMIGGLLERLTELKRGATAEEGHEQLVAANLDVVFVV